MPSIAVWLAVLALLASACGTDNVAAPPEPQQPPAGSAVAEEPGEPSASEFGSDPGESEPDGPGVSVEPVVPESAGECGPDEPGVSAAEDLTQAPALRTAPDAAPEDLSADPVIEWVEFDPGIGEVAWLKSVGDGRVQTRLAKFTTEKTGDNRTTTTQTSTGPDLVTSDGIRWDELPLPEGIDPHIVDISSDLWLVTERPTEILFSPARVFVSRDRGATWLEVPVDSAPLVPHTVEQHLGVSAALVSDGFIVLSANIHSLVDAEALLLDRGLISESQVAGWLSFSDDILTAFVLSDPEVVEGIRNKTRTIWQTPFGREDIVEFTAEELDLTARQRQLLERPIPADPLSEGALVRGLCASTRVTNLELRSPPSTRAMSWMSPLRRTVSCCTFGAHADWIHGIC